MVKRFDSNVEVMSKVVEKVLINDDQSLELVTHVGRIFTMAEVAMMDARQLTQVMELVKEVHVYNNDDDIEDECDCDNDDCDRDHQESEDKTW